MAQVTGTYSSYDIVGQREELMGFIAEITPDETPLYSDTRKVSLKSKHPEWQTDVVRAPAANAQIEGDDYSYSSKTPTVRVGNYTQIFRETGLISGTADVVDKAGRDRELVREKMKSGLALRKDVERSMCGNFASVAGDDTTARVSAGFCAWMTSNDSRGAAGSDGGFSGGIVAAATNGTQRAFTKAIADAVMAAAFGSGGNVRNVYISTYAKGVQSTFMSDTNVVPLRRAATDSANNTIIGAVDAYLSDYGIVTFKINRQMTASGVTVARNVLFVDPAMIQWGWLRPIQEDKDVAKTGDAEPYAIIAEGCLIMKNEAAHGVAADIYGTTAST